MRTLNEIEMFALFIRKIDEAGGQAQFLRQYKIKNISRSYLNDMVHGRRAVSRRLLPALGLERVYIYRRLT